MGIVKTLRKKTVNKRCSFEQARVYQLKLPEFDSVTSYKVVVKPLPDCDISPDMVRPIETSEDSACFGNNSATGLQHKQSFPGFPCAVTAQDALFYSLTPASVAGKRLLNKPEAMGAVFSPFKSPAMAENLFNPLCSGNSQDNHSGVFSGIQEFLFADEIGASEKRVEFEKKTREFRKDYLESMRKAISLYQDGKQA